LKIDQKPLEDHQIHLTVEVDSDRLQDARRRAARQIAKRVKVPGFRPGKAPYNVIEKQVGPEAIEDEAMDIVLDDVYPQVIEETGIKPWGPGTLEKVNEEVEPRVFEFRVPLSPVVTLGDYQKVRIKAKTKKVTQADIDKVLENLRSQQATLEPVERAAQEGDMVTAMVSGERDEADENGHTTILPERSYPIVIEKADSDTENNEWPFPGFSRKLLGMKAGDEKTFKHKYAKDSEFEELQGASATFKVQVEGIKDRVLPELTDEFAQSMGDYETMDALLEEIKTSLEDNFASEQQDEYENAIVDKLLEDAEIKYAPQMLKHEIDHYIEDLGPQLARQGMDIDSYLKSREMDMDALRDEVLPNVEARLKRSLLLMQVAEVEEIQLKNAELEMLVQERIGEIQRMLSEQDAQRVLSGENLQGLINRTMSQEIVRRTLERLRAIASGDAAKAAKAAKEAAAAEVSATKAESAGAEGDESPAKAKASKKPSSKQDKEQE
jgi:trigger factor